MPFAGGYAHCDHSMCQEKLHTLCRCDYDNELDIAFDLGLLILHTHQQD